MPERDSREWTAEQAVDPDVDLHVDEQRTEWTQRRWTLPAISVGGMVGATMRHLVEQLLPHDASGWPLATLLTNVSGCFLLGALMAVLSAAGRSKSLWRISLGVGVLGGYTTFSTYAVQASTLIDAGEPLVAGAYLSATVIAACTSVLLGLMVGNLVVHALGPVSR